MKPSRHYSIDQVENGWIVNMIKTSLFEQPKSAAFIADTIGAACTMIVQDAHETDEVKFSR